MTLPDGFMLPMVQRVPGMGLINTPLGSRLQAGLRGHGQVDDLTSELGRATKPKKALLVFNQDTKVLTLIVTSGETEMAELQDLAHETIERNAERAKKNAGRAFDFDAARERAGLPPVAEAANRFREAVAARVAQHRANPVTDPFRQPRYPNFNGRKLFTQGDNATWQGT